MKDHEIIHSGVIGTDPYKTPKHKCVKCGIISLSRGYITTASPTDLRQITGYLCHKCYDFVMKLFLDPTETNEEE